MHIIITADGNNLFVLLATTCEKWALDYLTYQIV